MTTKDIFRKELLAKRKEQNQEIAKAKSIQAQQLLLAENIWKNAACIGLYMPTAGEIDTKILLEAAWQDKKTVLLPRCDPKQMGIMDFFICDNYNDLERGNFNILEPKAHTNIWQNNFDLLIVPAVGFDKKGYRIGFGGGYYDRFLSRHNNTPSLGLAFAWQILDNVPENAWNEWDMQVNAIVSEDGVLWT